VPITADNLPDNLAALKRIIATMAQDALSAQAEIARLKFQLARYRRAEFGRSSEKLAREAEQLELALEALESDQAERLAMASPEVAAAVETATEAQKPARRPLPPHLPREDRRHPAPCTCPDCGGALRKIADEVSETLDYVPGRFKVVRHIREKLSCRVCDTVVAAPVPDHAIARGRAGVGLLAHIVVSKYDDHLPLYRQAEIFARDGVSLETSTLSGWVGATAAALQPLVDVLAVDVLASDTLHVDDTPVPVLAPGTGKTKTGRLWTYVRDERPFGGARPPVALFFYSPDRKGEHPQAHLKDFRGVIHADGGACPRAGQRPDPGAGFNELFVGGRIVEAGCWAHVRRKFFDVHTATGSPIAKEALDRIGQLYAVEKVINRSPPERRRQQRQLQSKPIAEALAAWADNTVRQLSRKSELAQAFRYMRARWTALVRCFDDGRLALDNNPAERALRCVAIGRKNYLFAGSDAGGRRAAAIYSLIETAKLNGLNPQRYLADVLTRIADHPARRIAELLPWNWQPLDATRAAA
jgi:transposase